MEKGHRICYTVGTILIGLTDCDSESEQEERRETDRIFLFYYFALEKDGEDQLDRSCEK